MSNSRTLAKEQPVMFPCNVRFSFLHFTTAENKLLANVTVKVELVRVSVDVN
jgi:hypothetical protein